MRRQIGSILYRIIDTGIFILCLPFYAVAIPLIALHDRAVIRFRKVRLGLEITHWPACDQREDLRVVDVSRLGEGLVGVQRREWNVLHQHRLSLPEPPFSNSVEFCNIRRFWLGSDRRGVHDSVAPDSDRRLRKVN